MALENILSPLLLDPTHPAVVLDVGCIVACNPLFLSLVNLEENAVIGRPLASFIVDQRPNQKTQFDFERFAENKLKPELLILQGNAEQPSCVEVTVEARRVDHKTLHIAILTPITQDLLQQLRTNFRRHRTGVEMWNVGLYEHDHLTGKIFASPQFWSIVGMPPSENYTLEQFGASIHPDDRNLETILKSHDPAGDGRFDETFRIVRPTGEIRWIHSRAQSYFGNVKGKHVCVRSTGTMLDITERHILKIALEKNKHELADILNSLPSVVLGILVDDNGEERVTLWNKMAEEQTGIKETDALHRKVTDVYPVISKELESIKRAISEQEIVEHNRVPYVHDNTSSFFNVSIIPLSNDTLSDAVIRVDDVTEQMQFEQMLVHSEKLLSVGGLAAGMAHEINNPLAAAIQSVQVIKSRLTPELPANRKAATEVNISFDNMLAYLKKRKILQLIDAIGEAGNRAAVIVKNMLGFVRISNDVFSYCSLPELTDTTIELALSDYDLAENYDFRKIDISRQYDPNLVSMYCDPGKIQQVLLNLFKNAGQSLFDAQISSPQICIRILHKNDAVRIEFEDNGPGIPDAISRRIFEPFFTTKKVGTGTGLGLSISYVIITKDHNGKMRVEKSQNGGAKFVIDLPLNAQQHNK